MHASGNSGAAAQLLAFLDRTATQGERTVAIIRLVIAGTVLLQFLTLRKGLTGLAAGSPKHWMILAGIGFLAAFSAFILASLRAD